jgi:predicted amidohydrolase
LEDKSDSVVVDRKTSGTYRVATCQFEPVFLDKEANIEKMGDMARRAALAGAQLVIFPECCVTGYGTGHLVHEMAKLAEIVFGPNKGQTVQRIEALANELDIWIVFGLPELINGTIYNSSVNVMPEKGVVGSFYKLHLWEAEAQVFSSGKSFSIWDGPLGRMGSLICFDLEFPEAARTLTLMGAQLLAVPTANMRPWEEFQRVYARARAMENSMFVAVSNCIGKIGSGWLRGYTSGRHKSRTYK